MMVYDGLQGILSQKCQVYVSWLRLCRNVWHSGIIKCKLLDLTTNSTKYSETCDISGFRREVVKNCSLIGCCAECSKNCLPTFRNNLLIPSVGQECSSLKMGLIAYPETSVNIHRYECITISLSYPRHVNSYNLFN
jgi:hypothetical protein